MDLEEGNIILYTNTNFYITLLQIEKNESFTYNKTDLKQIWKIETMNKKNTNEISDLVST